MSEELFDLVIGQEVEHLLSPPVTPTWLEQQEERIYRTPSLSPGAVSGPVPQDLKRASAATAVSESGAATPERFVRQSLPFFCAWRQWRRGTAKLSSLFHPSDCGDKVARTPSNSSEICTTEKHTKKRGNSFQEMHKLSLLHHQNSKEDFATSWLPNKTSLSITFLLPLCLSPQPSPSLLQSVHGERKLCSLQPLHIM